MQAQNAVGMGVYRDPWLQPAGSKSAPAAALLVAESAPVLEFRTRVSPANAHNVRQRQWGTADAVIKTIVIIDLLDSTALLDTLGDAQASVVFARCDRAARNRLAECGGQEIDKSDGFLLLFNRPIDACRYVLAYHAALAALSTELGVGLFARAGIHLGEVVLRENAPDDIARGAKPIEVEGLAKPTVARLAGLAQGQQTLLTRSAFELARRADLTDTSSATPIQWLAHGPYLFKGVDEPLEVFEVGVEGFAPLSVPPNSEKARRAVAAGDETTLGWRPAPGQEIPHRANWVVREKLGEGGFGEVWLVAHKKTGDRRVFKFCFQADRLRSLRREVTLFRLMKEALGDRGDIARVLDWQFDEPPYFLESEYTAGGNFTDWADGLGGLDQIPLATRLELIAQVAVALSAAHSVGVLHKDIKPANVLIATDPQAQPKARLTDFGIGLVQNEALLLERGITVYGLTGMSSESPSTAGTRIYMAPEVIEGKVASVQADIYALGVMLYQAVVGDFGRALTSNWDRDIPDALLREDIAALVDGSPGRRLANAAEISERLRTLELRRARRLEEQRRREDAETARLALERALRRRRQFTTLAAIAGSVLLVVSVLGVQAVRAHGEADLRRGQAEELISFMVGDLRSKLTPAGRLDVLDEVGKKALAYFAAIPKGAVTDADLMRRSKTLSQIGEVRMAQGKLPDALGLFQESLAIATEVTARNGGVAEWQEALGASHFWIGDALRRQRDLKGALAHWQRSLDISKALTARNPDNSRHQLALSSAFDKIGMLRELQDDLPGAQQAYRDSLAIQQQVAARNPEKAWKVDALRAALAEPARPQADRNQDADRKPAELMTFFGVERGMTVLDLMAAGGFVTEVLSVAVGPTGKVYAQNATEALQYNNGVYDRAIGARLAYNRLPNARRLDGELPGAAAPGRVDVAVTNMDLHDIYNDSPPLARAFMKKVYSVLKPGGVFGVVDHAGLEGRDNFKLHRMQTQQAIDIARAAGFVVEAESEVLADARDDHSKSSLDLPDGKTDRFVLRLRKPRGTP